MNALTPARRLGLVRQIETTLPNDVPSAGHCLPFAHAAANVLHSQGLRPVLQAGSMQWPIMPQEQDDGRDDTHFAYMWEPGHPASQAAIEAGKLPEMHVWVGLPDTQELIEMDGTRPAGVPLGNAGHLPTMDRIPALPCRHRASGPNYSRTLCPCPVSGNRPTLSHAGENIVAPIYGEETW